MWSAVPVLSTSFCLCHNLIASMATRYLLLVAFAVLSSVQARTLPSSAQHALSIRTEADLLAPSPRATTITPDPKYEPLMCARSPRLHTCAHAVLYICPRRAAAPFTPFFARASSGQALPTFDLNLDVVRYAV